MEKKLSFVQNDNLHFTEQEMALISELLDLFLGTNKNLLVVDDDTKDVMVLNLETPDEMKH